MDQSQNKYIGQLLDDRYELLEIIGISAANSELKHCASSVQANNTHTHTHIYI